MNRRSPCPGCSLRSSSRPSTFHRLPLGLVEPRGDRGGQGKLLAEVLWSRPPAPADIFPSSAGPPGRTRCRNHHSRSSLASCAFRRPLSTRSTMASVSLDSQIFFTPPMAAGPKPRGPKPDCPGAGSSQDCAVLISSDDESDYGDFDDGQSDTSFPSVDELLRQYVKRQDVETGSVAGAGTYLNSPSPGQVVRLIRLSRQESQYCIQCRWQKQREGAVSRRWDGPR